MFRTTYVRRYIYCEHSVFLVCRQMKLDKIVKFNVLTCYAFAGLITNYNFSKIKISCNILRLTMIMDVARYIVHSDPLITKLSRFYTHHICDLT